MSLLKNTFLLIFAFFCLLACDAGNEYGYGYNDWYEYDIDESDLVTEDEFTQQWEKFGTFQAWDQNGDGYLNEKEWLEGSRDYYGDWDQDKYGYYDDWDTNNDGELSTTEVAIHTFDMWDLDGDTRIQKQEFETIHPKD